jgi:galactonate dehydratase
MQGASSKQTRRTFVGTLAGAAALALGAPRVVRAQSPLTLRFRTIPDPDGWHPILRLKGDWLIFEITDGRLSGFGEASHSMDDERCMQVAAALFAQHYTTFVPSLESLTRKEREIAALAPDFVTATALSGLNQALYELLAKREGVPVWRLFRDKAPIEGLRLYTTINRALATRTAEEYRAVVGEVHEQGFEIFKCAPFDAVDGPDDAIAKSAAGFAQLEELHERFPELTLRIECHERFQPRDFFELIPRFERLMPDWVEEPFTVGAAYEDLKSRTRLRFAGGELFWGSARFAEIAERRWVDVIMPDVKHVGGFGPLLEVIEQSAGKVEVSPHNPSGPISTAASLHAAAVHPEVVRSLEYSFDRRQTRRSTGERIERGVLLLDDKPGWGVEPPTG